MARPSRWNSPTEAVRIPAHAVEAVLALARTLDQDYVQNPLPNLSPFVVGVGEDRYLIQPPAAPAEQWAEVDELLDRVCANLTQDEMLWVLGELAQRWGKPINS